MKHYRKVFDDNPYIYHDAYPNVYVWRLMTPSGKPSKSMEASNEGWLRWWKSKRRFTEQELQNPKYSPSLNGVRKGYYWSGPFIYSEASRERESSQG